MEWLRATHILRQQRAWGPSAHVRDIASADYPTAATRPLNSRLSSAKFAQTFGWTAPDWRHSTDLVVRRLLKDSNQC
ncbi:sugar nucleotide-binding protein [Neoaquamicrobium sediminum]|uniref:sugar nucleotide-binding protein n=1 Tax=Neoaquamicrobium sediminum TaxID=1849104 RepID=UPI001FD2FCE2|nr:sugar nucleotide-binding protein [Mesorhizobium sediminum]